MSLSHERARSLEENMGTRLKAILERMDETKALTKKKLNAIRFNPLKPKSSFRSTPIMEEFYGPANSKSINNTVELVDLEDITKDTIKFDKEEYRKEARRRFRPAWKPPGEVNKEFGKLLSLRPKVLSEWDISRVTTPARSYEYNPERTGIKVSRTYEEFGKPSKKLLSQGFKDYLQKFSKQRRKHILMPSLSNTLSSQSLLEKVNSELASTKDPFVPPNTSQHSEFGFNLPALRKHQNSIRGSFIKVPDNIPHQFVT